MTVDTEFQIAVLAVQTGIQTRKKSDGFEIFFGRFVFVFEAALVAFGAGTAKVMIVAEFIACCAALDLV